MFENPADYDDFKLGQKLVIENARGQVKQPVMTVKNEDTGREYKVKTGFSELETEMILAGGKINQIKG